MGRNNWNSHLPEIRAKSLDGKLLLGKRTVTRSLHLLIRHSSCYLVDSCRVLDFRSEMAFEGKQLINHVIQTIEDVLEDFCGSLCFMEHDCVSYNVEISSGSQLATKCELNNSTHKEHPGDLRVKNNYIYRGSEVIVPLISLIEWPPSGQNVLVEVLKAFSKAWIVKYVTWYFFKIICFISQHSCSFL